MKIQRRTVFFPVRLKDFAEEQGLELIITQDLRSNTYIASFRDGPSGYGDTEQRAVADLCKKVQSNCYLINGKDIRFPDNLSPEYE